MALIVADDAVQVALHRDDPPSMTSVQTWSSFGAAIAEVKITDEQPDSALVVAVLAAAAQIVDEHTRRRRRIRPARPPASPTER
jgi:hypothetical protein